MNPTENGAVILPVVRFCNANTPSLANFRRKFPKELACGSFPFTSALFAVDISTTWQRCYLVSAYVLVFVMAREMTFREELSNVFSCVWFPHLAPRTTVDVGDDGYIPEDISCRLFDGVICPTKTSAFPSLINLINR